MTKKRKQGRDQDERTPEGAAVEGGSNEPSGRVEEEREGVARNLSNIFRALADIAERDSD